MSAAWFGRLPTPNRDALTLADGTITDPSLAETGLFDDGGNLILGANAPVSQIKFVQDGTAMGGANTLRDAMMARGLVTAERLRMRGVR